jgi:hypothetical protein
MRPVLFRSHGACDVLDYFLPVASMTRIILLQLLMFTWLIKMAINNNTKIKIRNCEVFTSYFLMGDGIPCTPNFLSLAIIRPISLKVKGKNMA